MKLLDRIKLLGKKAEKKVLKVSTMEELQYYIEQKALEHAEMKDGLKQAKAELAVKQQNCNDLYNSKAKLESSAQHYIRLGEEENQEVLKNIFTHVQATQSKIDLFEKSISSLEIIIKRTEEAVSVTEREITKLKTQLDELRMKDQLSKSLSKYANLTETAGINEGRIDDLINEVEVNYKKAELTLEEKSNENSLESLLQPSEEDSYKKFINSLK